MICAHFNLVIYICVGFPKPSAVQRPIKRDSDVDYAMEDMTKFCLIYVLSAEVLYHNTKCRDVLKTHTSSRVEEHAP